MKNLFNPILIILLFGTLSYIVWKNFAFDYILTGEIMNTKGVIFETRIKQTARGRGTLQILEYAFEINGKYHFGQKQIGNSHKWQYLGNLVNIEYERDNPEKSNITKFINNFPRNEELTLYSHTNLGYCQLKKTNNIIDYTEFGKKGVVLYKLIGISNLIEDTLLIHSITEYQDSLKRKPPKYIFQSGLNEKVKLIDIENGWTLRE